MNTKEEILDYCQNQGVQVYTEDASIFATKSGTGDGGKKISVSLDITQDSTKKTWAGSCIGLGENVYGVAPKEAIDEYKNRVSTYGHELD